MLIWVAHDAPADAVVHMRVHCGPCRWNDTTNNCPKEASVAPRTPPRDPCYVCVSALVATVGSRCGVALTHNPSDRSMHWPKSRGCGCCWHPAADVHVPAADAVATDDAARGNVHAVFPCKMQSVSKCSRYNKAKPGKFPFLLSPSLNLVCRINFALSFRLRIIIISGNG